MSIGANLAVIAAGAILSFATHVHTAGFSIQAVGAVLILVGAVSLFLQIQSLARQRELTAAQAEVPPDAVLVRPPGAPTPPMPSGARAGTTAQPLDPESTPYRFPADHTGTSGE
jgi:hypothetical protein